MFEILYITDNRELMNSEVAELEQIGFQMVHYVRTSEELEEQRLEQTLQNHFYYCVIEEQFCPQTARLCSVSGTKYLTQIGKTEVSLEKISYLSSQTNYLFTIEENIYRTLCGMGIRAFYGLQKYSLAVMLDCAFQDGEWEIYEAIGRLEEVKKNSGGTEGEDINRLTQIKDASLLCMETDRFFRHLEMEKNCKIHLKQQMMKYVDHLLQSGMIEAWNELLVWNKRYGVRELKSQFHEFYILWRILLIYVKELKEWYENNKPVMVVNLHSMNEITEVYLQIIFLLRRLEYELDEEAGAELLEYVSTKRISFLFVDGVMEVAQIENKEKVRQKLKGLWG